MRLSAQSSAPFKGAEPKRGRGLPRFRVVEQQTQRALNGRQLTQTRVVAIGCRDTVIHGKGYGSPAGVSPVYQNAYSTTKLHHKIR